MDKTEKKVIKLISKYTGIKRKKITSMSRVKEELGLSSFDFACLLVDFEEIFNIKIEKLDNLSNIEYVGDIVNLIKNIDKS